MYSMIICLLAQLQLKIIISLNGILLKTIVFFYCVAGTSPIIIYQYV